MSFVPESFVTWLDLLQFIDLKACADILQVKNELSVIWIML